LATESWSTFFSHATDADFRVWGQELNQKLTNIGLVQTTDTGQIDWVTVVKPGALNTDAGFEVWRFNDSLQGTSPIYFKLFFGNGGSLIIPRLRFQFGTGSDGAGSLTGPVGPERVISPTTAFLTPGSFQSFLSHSEGFLALNYKAGAYISGASNFANFVICRSTDVFGQVTGDAAIVYYGSAVASTATIENSQSFKFGTFPFVFSLTKFMSLVPGNENNSNTGTDIQVYAHWMLTPQVRPVFGVGTIFNSEITFGATFTATLVGSQPRTYLSVGTQGNSYWQSATTNTKGLAILWE